VPVKGESNEPSDLAELTISGSRISGPQPFASRPGDAQRAALADGNMLVVVPLASYSRPWWHNAWATVRHSTWRLGTPTSNSWFLAWMRNALGTGLDHRIRQLPERASTDGGHPIVLPSFIMSPVTVISGSFSYNLFDAAAPALSATLRMWRPYAGRPLPSLAGALILFFAYVIAHRSATWRRPYIKRSLMLIVAGPPPVLRRGSMARWPSSRFGWRAQLLTGGRSWLWRRSRPHRCVVLCAIKLVRLSLAICGSGEARDGGRVVWSALGTLPRCQYLGLTGSRIHLTTSIVSDSSISSSH